MSTDAENRHSYMLKEYETLQARMAGSIKYTKYLEGAAIIGMGSLYAWIFSRQSGQPAVLEPEFKDYYIYWVPFGLSVLYCIRHCAECNYIRAMGRYVKEIEKAVFNSAVPQGWEHFFTEECNENGARRAGRQFRQIAYWLLLIGTALIFGCLHS